MAPREKIERKPTVVERIQDYLAARAVPLIMRLFPGFDSWSWEREIEGRREDETVQDAFAIATYEFQKLDVDDWNRQEQEIYGKRMDIKPRTVKLEGSGQAEERLKRMGLL